jgi:hypothetical protein
VNQREYNERKSRASLHEHIDVLETQLLQMHGLTEENELLTREKARIMTIVTKYVVESNDVGGIDANDLADRLRVEGFELDGDDE